MRFLVYALMEDGSPSTHKLAEDLVFSPWKPTIFSLIPPTLGWWHILWTFFHYFGVFRNRDYGILFIKKTSTGRILHRSCIVPAYFRWPFMNKVDLNISSTWTDPYYRRRGLAFQALRKIVADHDRKGRQFWYVTRENNPASIAVCNKAGFDLVGKAKRRSWMGFHTLGRLVMDIKLDDERFKKVEKNEGLAPDNR